jgi:glycosyltransferase involved in cell wall biosynthesis
MMVSEALACGTPVVGFNMGVVSNLVINNFNGYKAELKNANDLAEGLSLITQLSCIAFEKMSGNAVNSIEELSSFDSAKKILTDLLK